MRRFWVLLAILLLAEAASARGLDWCAAARASAPAASQEGLQLEVRAREMGERLDSAIETLAEAQPRLDRRLRLRIFYAAVEPWLDAHAGLCGCLADSGLASNACAELAARRSRACGLLPSSRGLAVACLTKGR